MYTLIQIWSRWSCLKNKQITCVRSLGASTNINYLEESKKRLEDLNPQKHTITYEIVKIENLI